MGFIWNSVVVLILAYILYNFSLSPKYRNVAPEVNSSYDYIIVGAGSAGSVLAARLSEDSDISVLILEAGGEETHNDSFAVPLASISLQRTESDWQYYTVPQKTSTFCSEIGNNRHYWPRGKVLGGTSMLNLMNYVRGNKADYDEWEEHGCTGWSYRDVLPYFLKSEDILVKELKRSKYHNVGGPLGVSREKGPLVNMFINAGKELGYKEVDYNGEEQIGFAASQVTVRGGMRAWTSREFLRPAMTRKKLHVLTNSHVTKVIFDYDKRATGISYVRKGVKYDVQANKEVILSAGSIGSPQILMLSGIGPQKHLESLNIPIVANLPVGCNLQDHLLSVVFTDINTTDSITKPKAESLLSIAKYALFKTGPLVSCGIQTTAFIRSDLSKKYPDVQIHMFGGQLTLGELKFNRTMLEDIISKDPKEGIIIVPVILHPKSRG